MFLLSNMSAKDVFIDIPKSDFNGIVFHIIKSSRFSRKNDAFKGIIDRENLGTTAVGNNIGIPHCRLKNFKGFYVKFALFREKFGYTTPDGGKVRFMFLIVGSEDDAGYYLRTLAHIAKVMRIESVRNELVLAKNRREICKIFRKYENKELEKAHTWK